MLNALFLFILWFSEKKLNKGEWMHLICYAVHVFKNVF